MGPKRKVSQTCFVGRHVAMGIGTFGVLVGPLTCSPAPKMSRPQGHYENTTAKEIKSALRLSPRAIPEYHPTATVIISSDLIRDDGYGNTSIPLAVMEAKARLLVIAPSFEQDGLNGPGFAEARNVLAAHSSRISFLPVGGSMSPSTWARDWTPISARGDKGQAMLLDFNYHSTRPSDDYVPQALRHYSPHLTRLSVPVYLEGGNFMATSDGVCWTTQTVVDANRAPLKTYIVDSQGQVVGEEGTAPLGPKDRLVEGTLYFDREGQRHVRIDDLRLSSEDLRQHFEKSVGCQKTHILPRMPHEETGHIDMWAKLLNDKVVIVGTLDLEKAPDPWDPHLKKVSLDIAQFLDERARDFARLGLKVVRIPMPLPQKKPPLPRQRPRPDALILRSYTNSLILVTPEARLALVPRYHSPYGPGAPLLGPEAPEYTDQTSLAEYEARVAQVYQDAGFAVRWIDSDQLIVYGGAVHCATMQSPFVFAR